MDMSVSACIVTYNNADKIARTVRSILEHTKGVQIHLFVSDNKSGDNTVKLIRSEFPEVTVLDNPRNGGFGWGHNRVLPMVDSEFHAIINPDIIFTEDVITGLAGYMRRNPDVAICAPKICNEDGSEQFVPKLNPTVKYILGGRFENRAAVFQKWRDEYTLKNYRHDEPFDIEFMMGSFMFVRTGLFKQAGGFDERYFMYFEDADLTRKMRSFGRAVSIPEYKVIHLWERASARQLKYFLIQLQSMFRYFSKWGWRFW